MTQLPADSAAIVYNGSRYFYSAGTWYQQVIAGYVVATPPEGIVAPVLPYTYTTVRVGDRPYYYANGVYYTPASAGGYVVVAPPGGGAGQGNWYYCDSAKAYYPYVQSCAEGWSIVSPVPPQLR